MKQANPAEGAGSSSEDDVIDNASEDESSSEMKVSSTWLSVKEGLSYQGCHSANSCSCKNARNISKHQIQRNSAHSIAYTQY